MTASKQGMLCQAQAVREILLGDQCTTCVAPSQYAWCIALRCAEVKHLYREIEVAGRTSRLLASSKTLIAAYVTQVDVRIFQESSYTANI